MIRGETEEERGTGRDRRGGEEIRHTNDKRS
jgi:hypothetical protein